LNGVKIERGKQKDACLRATHRQAEITRGFKGGGTLSRKKAGKDGGRRGAEST